MIADNEIEKLNGYVGENLTLELHAETSEDERRLSVASSEPEKFTLDDVQIKDSLSSSVPVNFSRSYCRSIDFSLAHDKIESFINWSIATYKTTREIIQEKLGKTTRTVDVELEEGIDALREVQRRYVYILTCINQLTISLRQTVSTQYDLCNNFLELSEIDKDLCDIFKKSAGNEIVKSKNNKYYFAVLENFASSLQLLCETTFEDTIAMYRNYETARLDFDVHRHDLETLQRSNGNHESGEFQSRIREAEQKVVHCRQKYEKLRDAVQTKMRLLHDNKVKVLHKNLSLFNEATTAYFAGDVTQLESIVANFNVKVL